jgi:hypothetical protein
MYCIGDVEINECEWNVTKFSGLKYTAEQILFNNLHTKQIITKDDIDLEMQFHQNTPIIKVSGLNQGGFDYFISTYGKHFKSIYFFGCKDIRDLSSLSQLQRIEYILFAWIQKSDKLWDMNNNYCLRGIQINDAKKVMLNLAMIPSAPNLEEIRLGGAIVTNHEIQDLSIFQECKKLRRLSLLGLTLTTNNIIPLTKIPALEILDYEPNFLETEQIAYLVAMLPKVTGMSMCAYNDYSFTSDIKVCGKGKPSLNIPKQQHLLNKYIKEFEDLVRKYKSNATDYEHTEKPYLR